MKKPKLNLGKRTGTIQSGSSFWIKKFENGVKIRKKGQGELTLDIMEVFEILLNLRKYPKKFGNSVFLTAIDLTYVWQKYPETQDFIGKLLLDEVSYEEKMKIHKDYMTKIEILENLKEKKE